MWNPPGIPCVTASNSDRHQHDRASLRLAAGMLKNTAAPGDPLTNEWRVSDLTTAIAHTAKTIAEVSYLSGIPEAWLRQLMAGAPFSIVKSTDSRRTAGAVTWVMTTD